jgi:hypothetical protein
MQIRFKAKVRTTKDHNGILYHYIKIPDLTRRHCIDMAYFEKKKPFSGFTNSVMFGELLHTEIASRLGFHIRLDKLPPCVSITPGFLYTVDIDVDLLT